MSIPANSLNITQKGVVYFDGVHTFTGDPLEGVSLFVVDSADNAQYTTIQTAINAAELVATSTTPQTVWIWPGTYTGNLNITGYVNLASAAGGVLIKGQTNYTPAANGQSLYLKGITFETVSALDECLVIAGSHSATIFIDECIFNGIDGGCFVSESTGGCIAYQRNCTSNASTGQSIYNLSNGSGTGIQLYAENCVNNSTDTASIVENSCVLNMSNCSGTDSFIATNTATLNITSFNVTGLSGAPLFQLGTGTTLTIYNSIVDSSDGSFWATGYSGGYGSINYNNIVPTGTANQIDTNLSITSLSPQMGTISFDFGATFFDPVGQGTQYQVLLGTGTSAVATVSESGAMTGYVLSYNSSAPPTWISAASGSVTINVDSSGSVSGTTLDLYANSGSANAGATMLFLAVSGTEIDLQTSDTNNNIMIGNSAGNSSLVTNGSASNIGIGAGALTASAGGQYCIAIGQDALAASTDDNGNIAIGVGAMTTLNGGSDNFALGQNALANSLTDSSNFAMGTGAMVNLNGGSQNIGVGYGNFPNLATGQYNLGLGQNAGASYTSSESSNISINTNGIELVGESNALRIGTGTGTGSYELSTAYIQGIYNNNSSGFTDPLPVFIDSTTGQLGYGTAVNPASSCAFSAELSTTQNSFFTDGAFVTLKFDTKIFDLGTNYSTSTNTFTAPATGYYMFTAAAGLGGLTDSTLTEYSMQLVTTGGTYLFCNGNPYSQSDPVGNTLAVNQATFVPMTSGDTAIVQITLHNAGSTGNANLLGANFGIGQFRTVFSGYRVA